MLFRIVLAGSVVFATSASAASLIPEFDASLFSGSAPVNPYFPLDSGHSAVLTAESTDDEGESFTERSELTVIGAGPTVLGVETTAQLDRAYEDGLLVEETYDYYATDVLGNVWYFGEDVTNYIYDDEGNLLETNNESAWLAGVDGALPGWIMPADPYVGLSYYQEVAEANDALDQAMVWALGVTVDIPGYGEIQDVLVTLETTELDPDAREFKYYAPGLGLIRVEEGLSEGLTDPELIFNLSPTPVPVPAGFPLLLMGIGAFVVLARRNQ